MRARADQDRRGLWPELADEACHAEFAQAVAAALDRILGSLVDRDG
jgi:hypothetical protein